MKRQWIEFGALCFLPVILLIMAISFQYTSIFNDPFYYKGYVTLITGVGALVGVLAIALAVYATFDRKRILEDKVKIELEERTKVLQIRMADQSREIELLAAMREVGLIVSREVDFEKILGGVLEVVEGLFSAESISIFLAEKMLDNPEMSIVIPKVYRVNGKTLFGENVPGDIDRTGVNESFEGRGSSRTMRRGAFECALPLIADDEVLGVLRIVVPIRAGDTKGCDEIEKSLMKIVRHLALAIKTPTLYDRAVVDALTRLYTKRHFNEVLSKLFYQSARLGKALSIIMIDIDHFKKFNDTYGHLTGDLVLSSVADQIKRSVRRYDTVYRYGGEEMAILLPEAQLTAAQRVARRVRKTIDETPFHTDKQEEVSVTVSCGVAAWTSDMKDVNSLVKAADDALYEAKEKGRNCVVSAS